MHCFLCEALWSGFFVFSPQEPYVIVVVAASQLLAFTWACYNAAAMARVKGMLIPRLVTDSVSGEPRVVRPDVEVTELREKFRINRAPPTRFVEALFTRTFGSDRPTTNRVQELFGPLGADGPDYFAASIKFQMWLSVSSLVSFGSQILLRDAAALSAGTAGALDRVPLEMGIFGLFCLLNIFELALVPTTFLNLGLIEVVEDFVQRSEDAPYAIDARDN